MKSITEIEGEARRFHYENSLPWTDEGAHILPTRNYFACDGGGTRIF